MFEASNSLVLLVNKKLEHTGLVYADEYSSLFTRFLHDNLRTFNTFTVHGYTQECLFRCSYAFIPNSAMFCHLSTTRIGKLVATEILFLTKTLFPILAPKIFAIIFYHPRDLLSKFWVVVTISELRLVFWPYECFINKKFLSIPYIFSTLFFFYIKGECSYT